jgi:hypothetical protein
MPFLSVPPAACPAPLPSSRSDEARAATTTRYSNGMPSRRPRHVGRPGSTVASPDCTSPALTRPNPRRRPPRPRPRATWAPAAGCKLASDVRPTSGLAVCPAISTGRRCRADARKVPERLGRRSRRTPFASGPPSAVHAQAPRPPFAQACANTSRGESEKQAEFVVEFVAGTCTHSSIRSRSAHDDLMPHAASMLARNPVPARGAGRRGCTAHGAGGRRY